MFRDRLQASGFATFDVRDEPEKLCQIWRRHQRVPVNVNDSLHDC